MENKLKMLCKQCNGIYYVWPFRKDSKFCSLKCKYNYGRTKTNCDECNKEFTLRISVYKYFNLHFCSMACKSKYTGKHYLPRADKRVRELRKFGIRIGGGAKGVRMSPKTEFKPGWQHTKHGREMIKKRLKSLIIKPNKPEQKLIDLLIRNRLPYKYVGNGEVILGSKNPDFLNCNGQKKIIELFSEYWHHPDVCKYWHQTEQGCKEYYQKYGFDTLIIWSKELSNPEKVLNKIMEFT